MAVPKKSELFYRFKGLFYQSLCYYFVLPSSLQTLSYTRWFKYDRDWLVCKQVTVCPGHIWTTLYLDFLALTSTPITFSTFAGGVNEVLEL
jgi:hypothetical protein